MSCRGVSGAASSLVERHMSRSGSSGKIHKSPPPDTSLSSPRSPVVAPGANIPTRNFPQDNHAIRFHRCFSSALSRCHTRPLPLPLSSRRLRNPGDLQNILEPMLTIDTAIDLPLISHDYLQRHPVLRTREVDEAPHDALQLRSANDSKV